jgi:hypothetical protein
MALTIDYTFLAHSRVLNCSNLCPTETMTTAEGDYYVLEPLNLCHSNAHRSHQGLGLELVRHQVAPASHPLGNDLSSY